ncbi:hypothetical protein BDZ91DRAFT_783597 [Kalaharituber pfeilii]|nr:hypothetical protein BDZ91DRAFT_783597 [Kalaharituber pfeilii]
MSTLRQPTFPPDPPPNAHTSPPRRPPSQRTPYPSVKRRGRERALPPPPPAPVVETDAEVDEAEWAAFEADIALTKQEASTTTTITNPPPSAVIYAAPTGPGAPTISPGLDQKAALVEDEAKLDREDAQNKLAEEFEEMESLESRVQRLKEQREALRVKALGAGGNRMEVTLNNEDEEDEEDDYEDEDWIHFSR